MSTEMSDTTKPPKAGGKGGIHMPPIFGPAGSSASFHAEGNKTTLQMFAWLRGRGLDAFEYQCGRGVRVSEEAAAAIKREAEANGIAVSLHAPYYISLASADEEKRLNSLRYIHDSALAVSRMGGDRIVVHPGGLGGLSRPEAAAKAAQTLRMAQRTLDEAGLSHVHICPETMGKLNQLGDLEEVLGFCELDERFTPCIDFGHLNSRTHGGLEEPGAYEAVLDAISNRLGEERGKRFHMHFSKIEYSAGGEKVHLTFESAAFGPDPAPLMALLARRGLEPVCICESAGTQAEDAAEMKRLYRESL